MTNIFFIRYWPINGAMEENCWSLQEEKPLPSVRYCLSRYIYCLLRLSTGGIHSSLIPNFTIEKGGVPLPKVPYLVLFGTIRRKSKGTLPSFPPLRLLWQRCRESVTIPQWRSQDFALVGFTASCESPICDWSAAERPRLGSRGRQPPAGPREEPRWRSRGRGPRKILDFVDVFWHI